MELLRRWRAILGTGLVGAGIGALLAGVVLGVSAVLAPGSVPLLVAVGGPLTMGAFGFVAAGGFATMLARQGGETSLGSLSVWKSGMMGIAAGSLFPLLGAALTGGFLFPFELAALGWAGATFGVLGGGIAAGLAAVAKDHEPTAIPGADSDERLGEAGATSERPPLPPATL